MSKKISLGAAIAFMAITAAVTLTITMIFSMRSFTDRVYSLKEREGMYKKYSEIDRWVRQNYYGTIDEDALMDAVASGYLAGLGDSYARYYTAEEYAQLSQTLDGTVAGLGISTAQDASGYMIVTEVYPDSPAEGVIPVGALIVKIDDLDVTKDNYGQAVALLTGEAGTKVELTIRQNDEDTALSPLTRRNVTKPTVYSRMINQTAYIRISEFTDSTTVQFSQAISEAVSNGAKALIFDVRENGGGTIKSVSAILDQLLPQGDIVSATYGDGTTKVLYTSDANQVELPMMILGNENSASASELFIQALRDYGKASFVGVNTMGKGSMQETFKLSDGSAIQLTVALYNPPKSGNFDQVGLKPDYEVKLSSSLQDVLFELDENTDAQLKKALELSELAIRSAEEQLGQDSSQLESATGDAASGN